MKITVKIKHRSGVAHAEAIYEGDKIVVKAGGHISNDFADHIKGGTAAKKVREDRNFVDKNGNIIKDCVFSSPSTAAQFVTGRSNNGYEAWKVEDKKSLGSYLKEKGLK